MFGNFITRRKLDANPWRGGAFIALLLGSGLACGAEPTMVARYRIDQPSQPLSESLRSIARQTGVSVLFDPRAVNGRISRAVSGELTAAEAIAGALDGSGLLPELMSNGAIVVRPAAVSGTSSGAAVHGAATSSADGAGSPSNGTPLRLAQASNPVASDVAADYPADLNGAAFQLTKVEITGSRLKRIDADGPVPVNTYTREDIDKSGQPTLERFLSSLNETSVSSGEGGLGFSLHISFEGTRG